MATQIKSNKCTCPSEYVGSLKTNNSEGFGKLNECQFGPHCAFLPFCNYNQEKCTCYPRCTCESETQPWTSAGKIAQREICSDPSCICDRICLCEPEKSQEPVSVYRPSDCDMTKCTCDTCLCKPEDSESDVLPGYFRNTLKEEAHRLMSDEMMTQKREEIKQLLREHEDNKKKELKDESDSVIKEGEKKVLPEVNIPEMIKPLRASSVGSKRDKSTSIVLPSLTTKASKGQTAERESKLRRKKMKSKRKYPISMSPPKTKSPAYYRRRQTEKKRPPRIRFYYSGGTESYGVKLGHQHCLIKPLSVPKHMGWLWNLEDHTKGIRERKGWPPGFIAKNVKDMIDVIKLYQDKADAKRCKSRALKVDEEEAELKDEPPILHIHKKGRTYNITFCPKNSDVNMEPIPPIPFSIREKKGEDDSDSSESTLEFELHSPRLCSKTSNVQLVCNIVSQAQVKSKTLTSAQPAPSTAVTKKKGKKHKSKG